jgi:hypothetical protein
LCTNIYLFTPAKLQFLMQPKYQSAMILMYFVSLLFFSIKEFQLVG